MLALLVYGLFGFFGVPRILETNLRKTLTERMDVKTDVQKIAFNPFTFKLTVEGLALTDAQQKPVAGFERFVINFQPTGIFRWAWSFKEVHLLGAYGRIERFSDEASNLSALVERWAETAPPEDASEHASEVENDKAPPRVIVSDLLLHLQRVDFIDHVPMNTFEQPFGPFNIHVNDLATLPGEEGRHTIDIVTSEGASVRWEGEITLFPLASEGRIATRGPHLSVVSDYLSDILNFKVDEGDVNFDLDYQLAYADDGTLTFRVDNFQGALENLSLTHARSGNPLFNLQQLAIQGSSLRWPEQTVVLGDIQLIDAGVWVERLENGEIDLANLINTSMASESAQDTVSQADSGQTETVSSEAHSPEEYITEQPVSQPASSWTVENTTLGLKGWQIHFTDRALPTPATLTVERMALLLTNVSNLPGQAIEYDTEVEVAGAQFNAEGSLDILPLANLQGHYTLASLPLRLAQPYINPLAKVLLQQGVLNVDGTLQATKIEDLTLAFNMAVNQLDILEKETDLRLLGWEALRFRQIDISPFTLQTKIEAIDLAKPYADFAIEADGSTTIDRILVPPTTTLAKPVAETQIDETESGITDTHTQANGANDAQVDTDIHTALSLQIGTITIQDGAANFADRSLPLPFDTQIQKLNGGISALVTDSTQPAEVTLEGQVGDHGWVQINGGISAVAPTEATDIQMAFRNVSMPYLTPYTIKFAGREIKSGKMDLNLDYAIQRGDLNAKNKVVLYDLNLGDKVEQPGAVDLPLDLALALLKDSNGNIDVELPVKGNVNSPSFGYGTAVHQALTQMLTSIVTSPFRLLGRLAGGESEDIGHIRFEPGRADLTPPEVEKIHKVGNALKQRPNLRLVLKGVYADDVDRPVLQKQRLDAQLKMITKSDDGLPAKTSKAYRKAVEKAYVQAELSPELKILEQTHQTAGEGGGSELDILAYVNAVTQTLINAQTIPPAALRALADARALAIRDAILAHMPSLTDSVVLTESAEVKDAEPDYVNLPLDLGVSD